MRIKLRTTLLFVADIQKSSDFYSKFFSKAPKEALQNFASFELENTFFNLHQADAKNPLSTGGSVGYFEVENLNEWIKKAEALGAKLWRGPLDTQTGWLICQIQDPFGNIIGLEENKVTQS